LAENGKIYAHITEDGRIETLQEHSDLCIFYFEKLVERKNLVDVFQKLENEFLSGMTDSGKHLYKDMLYHTIYLHDLGKINCNFQFLKMKNDQFKNRVDLMNCNQTNHSMLSSLLYMNEYIDQVDQSNPNDYPILSVFMVLNAYIISKHHGAFDSLEQFKGKVFNPDSEGKRLFTEQLFLFNTIYKKVFVFEEDSYFMERIFTDVEEVLKATEKGQKEISIKFYIYTRLVASLLLSSDFYATSHFKNETEITHFGEIDDINKFYQVYKATKRYEKIRAYEEELYLKNTDFINISDINILRNELFLDAERKLLNNMIQNIFYLEAPTGSGKSNVGFNLAFKMIEESTKINKIFYVYPFNTLIEQNMNTLEEIFKGTPILDKIAVVNSLVPIKKHPVSPSSHREESDVINDNADYVKSLLDRQFLHYPIVLTTHVSLFKYLFGTEKENLFPLAQIANSVIILDEIQSYKNKIWKEIITFLNHYASLLNIKVIIMSATLPNLSLLAETEIKAVDLIEDRSKYFQHPLFKNRVKLDFQLLEITNSIQVELLTHVLRNAQQKGINILIEFITKSEASEFYQALSASEKPASKKLRLLTGDDNGIDRAKIVSEFKTDKDIILVATQVIEAGVDIDADIGYKDISILDAEEQFLGRINRSCLKENGIVYFFNLHPAGGIYKNDVRKEKDHTLEREEIRAVLENKDFPYYYFNILGALNNTAKDHFQEFIQETINQLKFREIEIAMSLIDEQYQYSVFLSRALDVGNGEILYGDEVWDQYVLILEDQKMDYAQRKVKLSEATAKLNHFIYQVRQNNFTYEKHIGDLYYISDCDRYFDEQGKFDRKAFGDNLFI